ncbi:hypothetical protein VNO77_23140 [Canavalia gladiata]|uniref:Uncharacterized protein n=1 Tax=Canavalia gladiata TaxID=3824 RepID=A0AAN9L4T4_CANGL
MLKYQMRKKEVSMVKSLIRIKKWGEHNSDKNIKDVYFNDSEEERNSNINDGFGDGVRLNDELVPSLAGKEVESSFPKSWRPDPKTPIFATSITPKPKDSGLVSYAAWGTCGCDDVFNLCQELDSRSLTSGASKNCTNPIEVYTSSIGFRPGKWKLRNHLVLLMYCACFYNQLDSRDDQLDQLMSLAAVARAYPLDELTKEGILFEFTTRNIVMHGRYARLAKPRSYAWMRVPSSSAKAADVDPYLSTPRLLVE